MKFTKAAALVMSLSIAGAALCACNNQAQPVSSDVNVVSTQAQNSNGANQTIDVADIDKNAANSNFKFTYRADMGLSHVGHVFSPFFLAKTVVQVAPSNEVCNT